MSNGMNKATYEELDPMRAEIDALTGRTLLKFGAPWCGYCIAAEPLIEAVLAAHPEVGCLRIEDGPGRPLGRSFRVISWNPHRAKASSDTADQSVARASRSCRESGR